MKDCCKTEHHNQKKYRKKLNWIFYLIVLGITLFVITTGFKIHGDETPHGGIISHAKNGYSIEKVKGIRRMFFYLLTENETTTVEDNSLTGKVEFILKDGTVEKYNLVLSKDSQTLKIVFKERKKIKKTKVSIHYKNQYLISNYN